MYVREKRSVSILDIFVGYFVVKSKFAFVLFGVLVAVAAVSFEVGRRMTKARLDESGVYYTQAMLAFTHYTSYERIKAFLERGCYDAALTDAKEMRNLQMVLLSDNLKGTKNAPDLVEYINLRNPQLLKDIQAGHIPELHSYTTTCQAQPNRSK